MKIVFALLLVEFLPWPQVHPHVCIEPRSTDMVWACQTCRPFQGILFSICIERELKTYRELREERERDRS